MSAPRSLDALTAGLLERYCGAERGELAVVERKDNGVYLTADPLADLVAEATLAPVLERADRLSDLQRLRVLDPAVGGGALLLAAARAVRSRVRALLPGAGARRVTRALETVVRAGFVGIDVDPLAARVAGLALRLECSGTTGDEGVPFAAVHVADALGDGVPAQRWDAILSNPPWGKIKPNIREFYAALDPAVRDTQGAALHAYVGQRHQGRGAEYARYAAEIGGRAALLKAATSFTLQRHADGRKTAGDAEYYRFFLDRIFGWAAPGARLGLIVPIAFLNTDGAAGLRRAYLDGGRFEHLLAFENRERLFAIHGMYRFVVAVYERGAPRGVRNAAFALTSVAAARAAARARNPLPLTFLRAVSPFYALVPAVNGRAERQLLGDLVRRFPAVRDETSPWRARFVRECDMTQHAGHFVQASDVRIDEHLPDGSVRSDRTRLLPVYEGRLVDQFDARAKGYVEGNGRLARWQPLRWHEKTLRPHFYVREADAVSIAGSPPVAARAAYCDISGHANERTLLAALVPPGVICGNKVPTLRFAGAHPRLPALWVAFANSFVLDWVARRFVSTTVNFFYWSHVPMPFLDPDDDTAIALAALVGELHAMRAAAADEEDAVLRRRAGLRATIDGLTAHLFGLDAASMASILADFPLIDGGEPNGATALLVGEALVHFRDGATLGDVVERAVDGARRTPRPAYLRASAKPTP